MDTTLWTVLALTALLLAPTALALSPDDADDDAEDPAADAELPPPQAAFRLDQLEAELAATEGPWLPFFDSRSLRLGLYTLPAGGDDPQPVHEDDEVYYVIEGRATLRVGGENGGADDLIPVEPGSTVFVRAGIAHRFIDIEEALEVLVIFGATPDPDAGRETEP